MNPMILSKILADPYSMKILASTYAKPTSAQEISIKFDIPIAQCYRRIRTLESLGMVKAVKSILTKKGKRMKLYKSDVKNAYVVYEHGKLKVKYEMEDEVKEEKAKPWDVIDVLKA